MYKSDKTTDTVITNKFILFVENIIVIYLVGSDPSLIPPIFHCLILPTKLLTPPSYFHGSTSVLCIYIAVPSIILQYCFGLETVWIK
jgi:hypothetical protein